MLDILSGLAAAIGRYMMIALVTVINLLIEAVGLLIAALLWMLPDMPAPPTVPVADWLGWMNWLFPLGPMVLALSVFVALWAVFLVVRIPLKWVKAL